MKKIYINKIINEKKKSFYKKKFTKINDFNLFLFFLDFYKLL
jgi:hypothetical protein